MDRDGLIILLVVVGVGGWLFTQAASHNNKNDDCHIQLEQMQREFGSYRDAIKDARQ